MKTIYNFSAGPAALPKAVLEHAQKELTNWQERGVSVMEVSHRGNEFIEVAEQAKADLRALLNIPNHYKVLFLQGGARAQFAAVPLNILGDKKQADYINTGLWSTGAIKEAKRYCDVKVVADSSNDNFTFIPTQEKWQLNSNSAYVHYTPNETVGGLEFQWIPETDSVPLVADMSSNILSRPLDVSKFGVIYAGAQKNIGPAGLTIVIVREDLLDLASDKTPSVLHYKTQADSHSMYNTPPTFAWYMAGLVFKWLIGQGGLAKMAEINRRKADKLYTFIDKSHFYSNPIHENDRSWMNVPFRLVNKDLEGVFLVEAEESGMIGLKGHRSVGGIRASLYNAVPEEAVDQLILFMQDFENRH